MTNNKILKVVLKNLYMFIVFTLLSYVLSEIVVLGSGIISDAINNMTNGLNVDIKQMAVNTIVLIIISMIVAYFKVLAGEGFSIRVQRQCRDIAAVSLEDIDYSYVEKNKGAIITRLTSDTSDLGTLLSEIIPDVLQYAVTIITIGISLFQMEWKIVIGIIIIFPLVLIFTNWIAKKINDLAKLRRGKYDELTEIAQDNISGILTGRIFAIESVLGKRIDDKADEILCNEYARNRYQALANGITNLLKWIPTVVCSVFALIMTLNKSINVGELMAFLVLFNKITAPLSELPFRVIDGKEMLVSVKRLNEVINAPKEHSGNYIPVDVEKCEEIISLRNLSFAYDHDNNILKDVNLLVKKGQTVAVVGGSGAGKSTLFKVLCGLEKAVSGSYRLFQHEFSEYDIHAIRKQIALVSQDVFLFPDTIAKNIAYGSGDFLDEDTMKRIKDVCIKAGIHNRIMEFNEQYDAMVGERGALLSGGERQRISIARALYKNTPLILMDEPTSALDEVTEKIINDTLANNKEKTVVIIAHRLSTIKNADVIYVLENGKIVESGCHDDLISHNGTYASLYSKEAVI